MQTPGLGSCTRINQHQRLGRTQLACYLYICNGLSGACEPGNSYRGRERYIMRLLRLKSLFGRHFNTHSIVRYQYGRRILEGEFVLDLYSASVTCHACQCIRSFFYREESVAHATNGNRSHPIVIE